MNGMRRRKRYLIKPGFQSRLTMIFILIVIIVANLVGAIVYGISIDKLEKKLVDENKLPIEPHQLGQTLLPGVVIAELISICVVAFISIFVTHTIAGPVYRMERVARDIGAGNLTNVIKLRPKDELKDLADAMNDMTDGLKRRIVTMQEQVDRVRQGLEKAKADRETVEALDKLDSVVRGFVLERRPKTEAEILADREAEEKA